RCPGFRVAEDEQLGGRHVKAYRVGFAGMIYQGEEFDVPFSEECGEALDEFVDGVSRGEASNAVVHKDSLGEPVCKEQITSRVARLEKYLRARRPSIQCGRRGEGWSAPSTRQ